MSELNPYRDFLDGRPVDAILASTADEISRQLDSIGKHWPMMRSAPGKWSPAQIVCHLAECEVSFGIRLRHTLPDDDPALERFDRERWASIYPGIPGPVALKTFSMLRDWNLRLIRAAFRATTTRHYIYFDRETVSLETMVETKAGHDMSYLWKLQQITGLPLDRTMHAGALCLMAS